MSTCAASWNRAVPRSAGPGPHGPVLCRRMAVVGGGSCGRCPTTVRSWPGRRLLRRRLFAGDPPDRAVPVLVVAGTDDVTPAGSAQRLAGQIGEQADLVLANGDGHMVNVTHPATVTAALEELLARAQTGDDERRI